MNNMFIALQITALGMGLVFGAIILLWWMMALLTSITADKETAVRFNRIYWRSGDLLLLSTSTSKRKRQPSLSSWL